MLNTSAKKYIYIFFTCRWAFKNLFQINSISFQMFSLRLCYLHQAILESYSTKAKIWSVWNSDSLSGVHCFGQRSNISLKFIKGWRYYVEDQSKMYTIHSAKTHEIKYTKIKAQRGLMNHPVSPFQHWMFLCLSFLSSSRSLLNPFCFCEWFFHNNKEWQW